MSVEAAPFKVTISPCKGATFETDATATGAIPVTSTDTVVVFFNPSTSVTVSSKLKVSSVFGAVKVTLALFKSLKLTGVPLV